MTAEEFLEWQRLDILMRLDLAAARRVVPFGPDGVTPMSDEGLLIGMHKTRLHMMAMPTRYRLESLEWLRRHGFKDLHGAELPPPGQLPN